MKAGLSGSALGGVLRPLVDGALSVGDGVLARVWLTGPGDLCTKCTMRPECPDRSRCLHLVASAGLTTRLDGPFRRFPLGARQVGQVPLTREPLVATDRLPSLGLADPVWLAHHGIRGFAALPIEYGGEVIGVLAVFSRSDFAGGKVEALAHVARLGGLALGHLSAFRDLAGERNRLAARSSGRRRSEAQASAETPPWLQPLHRTEREVIERTLVHTGGRVSGPRGAAAILGLKPTTLQSRIKKLGVRRPPR